METTTVYWGYVGAILGYWTRKWKLFTVYCYTSQVHFAWLKRQRDLRFLGRGSLSKPLQVGSGQVGDLP